MLVKRIFTFLVLLVVSLSSVSWAVTWDILNEEYGNGSGQISFKNTYTWQWGGIPTETRYNGYVNLNFTSTVNYATRTNGTIGMPSDGNWRIDVKMTLPGKMGGTIYLADNQATRWGSIITINHLYDETVAHPDTIGDYNLRIANGGDIAPPGFDGSAEHIYSFRCVEGILTMFLDGIYLGTITEGAGAVGDNCELELGFGGGASPAPGTATIYYVKIASSGEVEWPVSDCCYGCYDLLNLSYLAQLAGNWLADGCDNPTWCGCSDLNRSGEVDITDYTMGAGGADRITLFEGGLSNYCIVNIGTPNAVEHYAAELLKDAFELATGVRPVTGPSGGLNEIRLGVTDKFTSAGLCESASEQGYVIVRSGDDIELVGKTAAAVLWAVDDFCEKVLKVSWPAYDSGPMLEGSQQSTLVAIGICETDAPDFERRGWHLGHALDGPDYDQQIVDFMGHNRQNIKLTQHQHVPTPIVKNGLAERGIEPDTNSHSFWWLIPSSVYCASHPEYFPEIGGVRTCPDPVSNPGSVNIQLCVSNPDVAQIIIDKAQNFFDDYPEVKVFGICPNDGSLGWCENIDCVSLDGAQAGTGNHSNRLMYLVNTVANAIAVSHPDRFIGTFAYDTIRPAPDVEVAGNVKIVYCTTGRNFMKKLTDPTDAINTAQVAEIQGWMNKGAYVYLYEYYYFSGSEFCPSPIVRTLCEEYPELLALGVNGLFAETNPAHWPFMRLVSYATARCAWDTSITYDELLTDYCGKMYGPAAAPMQAYHQLYETTLRNNIPVLTMGTSAIQLFPPALETEMAILEGYLDSATVAATSGSQGNIAAVQAERDAFEVFKSVSVDPADIPGIGPNLVTNPGAESGSAGWGSQVIGGGSYTLDTPIGSGRSSNRAFEIQYNSGVTNKARWVQLNIPITPGKKYAARFWIRANCLVSYGRLALMQYSGEYDVYLSWEDSSDQWVKLVIPEFYAVNSSVDIFMEMYGLGAEDYVYFDDVFFAELP